MKIIKEGTKTPPDKFTYTLDDIDCAIIPDYHRFLNCPQCEYRVSVPTIKRKYKGDKK